MNLRTVLRQWSALFALVCGSFVCFPAPLTAQPAAPAIPYPASGIDVGQQVGLQEAIAALPLELQDEIVNVITTGSRIVRQSLPSALIDMPPELRENIVDVMLLDPSEDTDVIMDVVVFLYADGSRAVGTMLDSGEQEGGPAHHVIEETDAISADVMGTHPVSVDLEAGTYTAKAWTREEMTEALESLTEDSTDEGTPLSQGILKPEQREQESESSVLPLRQLWQSVVDFFAPEAQAAGPTYRVEFTYFAYLNDGNRERLKSKFLMEKETGSLPANHV